MDNRHIGRALQSNVEKYGDRTALRYKRDGEWSSISWKSFGEMSDAVAKALIETGIKENDKIAIFANNCPEWTITDLGALKSRCTIATVHAPSTAAQTAYVVEDSGARIIFTGDQVQYDKVLTFISRDKNLEKVIVFDEKINIEGNPKAQHFSDFIEIGRASKTDGEIKERLSRGKSDDLLTIIYTSGTTGLPKGAMLAHSNIFHQFDSLKAMYKTTEDEISLSFLPLSHVFERAWVYCQLMNGAEVNYCHDPKQIIDFLAEVKPTVMCSVPRIYEKVYSAVMTGVQKASPVKQKIFNWATGVGYEHYRVTVVQKKKASAVLKLKLKLADKLALHKIRDIVGGRAKLFPSAGAPLAKEIEEFFIIGGVMICQGYGLTETSPTLTTNTPTEYKFGTVGKACPLTDIRLSDEGEIQVKSPSVMKGYYNKPDETKEVFTPDGYFKTGDVGVIDADGYLTITDRIKELIITAGGKNVAPQAINRALAKDFYIEQVHVIGNQRKYISALVVPAFPALEEYAESKGIAFSSREELVSKREIIQFYKERIDEDTAEFSDFEKIKKFTLLAKEFTVEDDEITPTNKIKRKVVEGKYSDKIDIMYN